MVACRVGSTLSYLLSDHIGSNSITVSDTGTKTAETRYKAWGEVRYQSGSMATDRTYTGQRSYTSDFGLMYYNARWYDSSIGRFAQADNIGIKVGDSQSLERYAYVQNNSINRTDPTGHFTDCSHIPLGGGRDACEMANKNEKLRDDLNNFKKPETQYEKMDTYNIPEISILGLKISSHVKISMTREESILLATSDYGDADSIMYQIVQAQSAFKDATTTSAALYSEAEATGVGPGNAFKHAYWNALLTKRVGSEFAENFTTAHEGALDADRAQSFMDLYNNAEGRRIAGANPGATDAQLQGLIMAAIQNGQMIVLDSIKHPVPYFSNELPNSHWPNQ